MNGKFMFGGPIPPFMFPFMQGQEDRHHSAEEDAFVPPRINKAMQFLDLLASKRRSQAAASDHTIEVIEQDKLCPEEEAARDAALQCLGRYFDGKMEQNEWEKLRYEALTAKVKQDAERPSQSSGPMMTRMMTCPQCKGQRQDSEGTDCDMCDGGGSIAFEPAQSMMPSGLGGVLGQILGMGRPPQPPTDSKKPPKEDEGGSDEGS